jgi:hypothetical protein
MDQYCIEIDDTLFRFLSLQTCAGSVLRDLDPEQAGRLRAALDEAYHPVVLAVLTDVMHEAPYSPVGLLRALRKAGFDITPAMIRR